MLSIALKILASWIGMGVIVALALAVGLYFAICCEKIVDFYTAAK